MIDQHYRFFMENILNETSSPNLLAGFHFLEQKGDKIIFPKKYMASLKSLVSQDIKRLKVENPEMPIQKVMVAVLNGLNEKLPSDMLLEITEFAIKKWENSTPVLQA